MCIRDSPITTWTHERESWQVRQGDKIDELGALWNGGQGDLMTIHRHYQQSKRYLMAQSARRWESRSGNTSSWVISTWSLVVFISGSSTVLSGNAIRQNHWASGSIARPWSGSVRKRPRSCHRTKRFKCIVTGGKKVTAQGWTQHNQIINLTFSLR